jgi:ribosomal RNA-processing protein 9
MPDSFFATSKKRKRPAAKSNSHASRTKSSKIARVTNGKEKAATKSRNKAMDEELESDRTDEDDGAMGGIEELDLRASDVDPAASGEEDEDETPAEKRLRLAKLYLESVKDNLAEGEFDAAEIDKEIISARLRQDVMEHAGKVHLFIADSVRVSRTRCTSIGDTLSSHTIQLELGEPSSMPSVRLRGHRFSVTSAAASEACTVLFTAGKEGSIIKWDIRTGKKIAVYHKQKASVKGKERAWNADVRGHMDEVLSLAISSDGAYLASAGRDRRVGVWDVSKGEWVISFGGHKDTISVRFHIAWTTSPPLILGGRLSHFGKPHASCIQHLMTALSSSSISVQA